MTIKENVLKLLKRKWYSAYALDNAVKSESGSRIMRMLRQDGIKIKTRPCTSVINGKVKHWTEYKAA